MPGSSPAAAAPRARVVILTREQKQGGGALRTGLISVGLLALLAIGSAMGYRLARNLLPETQVAESEGTLIERVNGGIYVLELAQPAGQARWMLELDADIVTREGPTNPLELRDALERLVIAASSLPLVQTAPDPEQAMRAAILAMAASQSPWLVDIHMRQSDIRQSPNRLKEIGEALRGRS